jgi:hypothetical protein
MKASGSLRLLVGVALLCAVPMARGDLMDFFKKLVNPSTNSASSTSGSSTGTIAGLAQEEIARGLKEALGKAVQKSVADLAKPGGFLNNLNVKIPMPPQLQQIEKGLRMMKQDKYADDFVATMNRAAERAVPESAAVLAGGISQMSLDDARAILKGPNDAATQFFRKTCTPQLTDKFRPIVAKATAEAGVTSAYKTLTARAGPLAGFLNKDVMDVDGYVTRKALDGLFVMVADEEKCIRENPAARTTDLLKKVFGAK